MVLSRMRDCSLSPRSLAPRLLRGFCGKLGFLSLGLVLLGCGRSPDRYGTLAERDLVASFSLARVASETSKIDFGTPEARSHLVAGWSGDRREAGRGRSFVRTTGSRSTLRFTVIQPRRLEVRFRCRPGARQRSEPIILSISLNGHPLEFLELRPRLATYTITLPEERLKVGENHLEFAYRSDQVGPGSAEPTPRVAWYLLEFPGASGSQPTAEVDKGSLYLPWGTQVDFFLTLAPPSFFSVERVGFHGAGSGRLSFSVTTDASGERVISEFTAPAGEGRVPLPIAAREAVRIRLRAVADGTARGQSGVRVGHPTIWFPSTSSDDPPQETSLGRGSGNRPHVFVYLIDTLRTDHLGCYGYEKPISPNIDRFAAEATLFENAVGQSSWTRSSVASLLTGLWPGAHGTNGRRDRLPEEAETVAEMLAANGYLTAAFMTNPNTARNFGFAQGFEVFRQVRRPSTRSDNVNRHVISWLQEVALDRPLFVYIHTIDPHDPYLPPEDFRRRFAPQSEELAVKIATQPRRQTWGSAASVLEQLRDLYDAEIAFNDRSFGEFLSVLRRLDLYENSFVVLVSDHGEEFREHGAWTHGKNLHGETLNFPFIVKFPYQEQGVRRTEVTQHIDLVPTLADYIGIAVPSFVEGRSLVDPRRGETETRASGDGAVFSHLHLDGPLSTSVVDGDWKLIVRALRRGGTVRELYNWRTDFGELQNRVEELPILAATLDTLLEEKLRGRGLRLGAEEAEIDEELERNLRALGYLN
jgi:arylsulfatase A-like enzyme